MSIQDPGVTGRKTGEPLCVSVNGALAVVPIGRTKLNQLMADGTIRSKVVHGRRWIDYQSLKQYAGVE